jgi:predicted Rossmann-fold nucleotide-binding protein
MQAIKTVSRRDINGNSYITASCQAKRIRVFCDSGRSIVANHMMAAKQLAMQLDWLNDYVLVSGALPDGSYAHVLVPGQP